MEETGQKSSRRCQAEREFAGPRPGFENGFRPLGLGLGRARTRIPHDHRSTAPRVRPATARVVLRDPPVHVRGASRVQRPVAALNQIHGPRYNLLRRGSRCRKGFVRPATRQPVPAPGGTRAARLATV
jgi:hypothetical protein